MGPYWRNVVRLILVPRIINKILGFIHSIGVATIVRLWTG
jgi:hypothetical protein